MKINFSKDHSILIERGSFYTYCGQSGNDEPEKTFVTSNLSVEGQFRNIFYDV